MIRIRQRDGSAKPVDEVEAVEILTSDHLLGMVIYTDRRKVINILVPGDPRFTGYCRTHGLSAAKVHTHDPYPIKPTMK